MNIYSIAKSINISSYNIFYRADALVCIYTYPLGSQNMSMQSFDLDERRISLRSVSFAMYIHMGKCGRVNIAFTRRDEKGRKQKLHFLNQVLDISRNKEAKGRSLLIVSSFFYFFVALCLVDHSSSNV